MIPLIVRVPAVEEQAEEAFKGNDGDMHLYCYRPNLALCGEDLTDGPFGDASDPTDCIRCEVIDEAGVPCGAPFCRLRSWVSGWWPW